MGLNVETNNAVLTRDIELETQEVKEKIKDKKIVYKLIKRIVDIIGGLVGTILLIPITAILYIANKISKENRGPLFFDQLRIGKIKIFILSSFIYFPMFFFYVDLSFWPI